MGTSARCTFSFVSSSIIYLFLKRLLRPRLPSCFCARRGHPRLCGGNTKKTPAPNRLAAVTEAPTLPQGLLDAIEASPIQLFALDFDNTITSVHVYNLQVPVGDVPKRWRGDVPTPEDCAAVLRAITAAGRSWCIVTFGQPRVRGVRGKKHAHPSARAL